MAQIVAEYARARSPYLYYTTLEPDRFKMKVKQEAESLNKGLYVWDCANGVTQELGGDLRAEEATDPTVAINMMATQPDSIWLLNNFHYHMRDQLNMQLLVNCAPILKANGIMGVVCAPDTSYFSEAGTCVPAIPMELEREILVLDFPLPTRDELAIILKEMTEENQSAVNHQICLHPERVLDAGQGLTWSEFENSLALSLVRTKTFDPSTVFMLKSQIVRKSSELIIGSHPETFDNLGGSENIKAWTKNRFDKWLSGKVKIDPKGIIILGVPGTGKSHFAKALANWLNIPCIILNFGALFGSLLGETEGKLRQALRVIDAFGHCVVFIDEIEKGLAGVGGSSTDGGTTQRFGGIFLSWMQDRTCPAFIVATANDINKLPPEYKRTGGRWDAVFFVDLPDSKERLAILEIYLRRFLETSFDALPDKQRKAILPLLDGYTGAEIRQVCIEAAYRDGDLEEAARFVVPISKSQKELISNLRSWAKTAAVPASLPMEAGRRAA